jgi:uncharacterized membrane protein
MAGAVSAVAALTVLLPDTIRLGPPWLLPAAEGLLLVLLMVWDPGKISRHSTLLRVISITLIAVLVGSALISTTLLIEALIHGSPIATRANSLMAAAVSVWTGNVLAFALLYWELDSKGPSARARSLASYPDMAFPQQMTPGLAPRGWRPLFHDYFYVSITNSMALSPSDALPLSAWAKMAMATQSLISFAVVALVIARVVSVF